MIHIRKKILQNVSSDAVVSGMLTDINGKVISLSSAYIAFEDEFGQGMSAMGDSIKTNLIATLTQAHGLILLMKADGSLSKTATLTSSLPKHKTGLDSVPYDGYVAELHKDETVLTADEAGTWRTIKSLGILNDISSMKSPISNSQLSNYKLPKMNTTDMSSLGNNKSTSITFTEPFMTIGNVGQNSMPDLEKFAQKVQDKVTSAINGAIANSSTLK